MAVIGDDLFFSVYRDILAARLQQGVAFFASNAAGRQLPTLLIYCMVSNLHIFWNRIENFDGAMVRMLIKVGMLGLLGLTRHP